MLIKTYNYSEKVITSLLTSDVSGQYIWVAFDLNSEGLCILQKVSAHNPLQIYFEIEISVTQIPKMAILGSYIYLAYNHLSLIGARYSLSNPLLTPTNFNIPVGITEVPVDIIANGSNIYYLIPGNIGGQNAKIVKLTTAGVFVETIDLTTVTKAKSFVMVGSEFWVLTYDSVSSFVRVYNDGSWHFTSNN